MISGAVVRDGRLELPTSCSQSKRATNCANPGFLVIQFCSRCGQTCGQAFFLTISACGGSACIAGVSRNCGHSIFRLEVGATRSQSRRATNCATPGYFVILFGWSYSPKPGAIPTSLYPDIQFLPLYHGGEENQSFFCLWSFMWSKPLLCRFRQPGKNPLLPVSQGFAAFRLTLSRIPPRHSQTRRDTSFAIPGYARECR